MLVITLHYCYLPRLLVNFSTSFSTEAATMTFSSGCCGCTASLCISEVLLRLIEKLARLTSGGVLDPGCCDNFERDLRRLEGILFWRLSLCNPSARIDWADNRAELTSLERRFGADKVMFDEKPCRDEGLPFSVDDEQDDFWCEEEEMGDVGG